MLVDERGRQFRIGVYGLAVTDGAVLLARLGPVEAEVGAWTLPGGGLDWGEHPLEGLERESVEETVYLVSARGNPVNEIDGSTDQAAWWPLDRLREVRLVELVEVALGWFSSLPAPRPPTG